MFRLKANVFVLSTKLTSSNLSTMKLTSFLCLLASAQAFTYPLLANAFVGLQQRQFAPSGLFAGNGPQPPGIPPPEEAFFAAEIEDDAAEEKVADPQAAAPSTPSPPQQDYEPEPLFSDEDLQQMQQFGSDLGNKAVDYIIVSKSFVFFFFFPFQF